MASTDLTTPSVNMLPVEDIADELILVHDFIKKGINASDVDQVAGVNAINIAVCVDPADRSTVNNALHLGGIGPEGFATSGQAKNIEDNVSAQRSIYGSEIRDLRDELYMLKHDLMKAGITFESRQYAGFQDPFKTSDPVHTHDVLATNQYDSTDVNEVQLYPIDFDKFHVDDFLVLRLKEYGMWHVCQITEKCPDGITIKFTPATSKDLKAGQVDLYKSLGELKDGMYNFFETAALIPGSKTFYTNVLDDTFRNRRQIKTDKTGFAYTFRITDEMKGFLSGVSIQARAYGSPGPLHCYIIDERNIDKWKNPLKAAADGILLAKSQPLTVDPALGERIFEFNFYDGANYPLLNEPDTVDHKVRYCAIIETQIADTDNYYDIMFLQYRDPATGVFGDLQLNNITYLYEELVDSDTAKSMTTGTTINDADLFFQITTREIIDNGFLPFREGVYTSQWRTVKPVTISEARATLRIAREGLFVSNSAPNKAYADKYAYPFKEDRGSSGYNMVDLAGAGLDIYRDTVIIGDDIRQLTNQNASDLTLAKGLYVEEAGDKVYRNGYKIYLRASLVELDPVKCTPVIKDMERIELPVSFVAKDRKKKDAKTSDRIIYEGFFKDTSGTRHFNHFELQIHWKTGYGGCYEMDRYKGDLVGRIKDLSISLDRGI